MTRAIETVYNGYRFRSRLEARWAVFFDALGIEYEYEPEGYELGHGKRWLPDFRLPREGGTLIEVKGGDDALDEDWEKLSLAVDYHTTPAGANGLLILGNIPVPDDVGWGNVPVFSYLTWAEGIRCDYAAFFDGEPHLEKGIGNVNARLFWPSGGVPLAFTSHGAARPGSVTTETRVLSMSSLSSSSLTTLKRAYKAARQARFEFGETPKARRLT